MKAIRVVMLLSWPLVAFCAAFTPRESNAQTPSILGAVTTQVTTGSGHTCALTTTGAVLCWGSNAYGVLGNNSTSQSNVAVPVSGLDSGVVAITAGADHTCALTTAGAVLCWGYNFFGDLGNNSNANSYVPVPVSNLSTGVVAITAGYDHTCALTTLGAVLCWGHNGTGQLGNNSTTDSHVPVPAVARYFGGAVAAITAGFGHTCALTTTGAVKCFGFDGTGALGNNSTTDSPIPVGVSGLDSGVAAIAAGATHTCALTTTGAMQCWGSNGNGQVGNNATTDSHVPVPVSTLTSGVMAITSGYVHTCALTTAGAMKCWGANSNGELGNNSITDSHVPTPVSSLANGVASIASGSSADHSCALTTQGVVFCWGSNSYGELGNNSTTESHWGQVLGRQFQRPARQQHAHRQSCAGVGGCQRLAQRCHCGCGRRISYVCTDNRGRRAMLGIQPRRTARQWHEYGRVNTCCCQRLDQRRGRHRGRRGPQLCPDLIARGQVLGQQSIRRSRQRIDSALDDTS